MKQRLGLAGMVATVAGIALMVAGLPTTVGAAPRTDVSTQTVQLHNATAAAGTAAQCPADTSVAYWHFIISPNNGSFSFVSITLNLGFTYSVPSGSVTPNGTQTDQVFVAVPAGSSLTDLQTSGSSAVISPAGGEPMFVLSHTCPAATQETTTTAAETTTTAAETTTTAAETTTTAAETTTTAAGTTTTSTSTTLASQAPEVPTTTTELVISEAPTTPSGALPVTGSTDTIWLQLGGLLVLLGITALSITRRRRSA